MKTFPDLPIRNSNIFQASLKCNGISAAIPAENVSQHSMPSTEVRLLQPIGTIVLGGYCVIPGKRETRLQTSIQMAKLITKAAGWRA